jgi:O-antigen ligase
VIQSVLLTAIVAALVWGALAFGAVYAWAYTPLAVASAVIGIAGLIAGRRGRPPISRLAIGLAAIGVAISLQLVPLPRTVLVRVSPGTDAFLRQYDFSYTHPAWSGESFPDEIPDSALPWQPISIAPAKTALGLGLFTALALLLLGTARVVSTAGARPVATAALGLGLLLTVLAVIQIALNPNAREFTLIYGFWRPQGVSTPFGPFVNPNHYAGWMLMALPLVLGLAHAALERADLVGRGLRERVLWVASKEGGTLVLSLFAGLLMGVSLMMTRSRSGIACLVVAIALSGGMLFLRQRRASARVAVAAAFVLVFLGAVAWAGVDTALGKFQASGHEVSSSSRLNAWKDTARIIRDSPVAGTGFDTYGTAMLVYQTSRPGEHFQEAHNDYLQLAAEGGLLVGLPILFTLAMFVAEVRRRFHEAPKEGTTYWLRVGAVVGLISIALQSLVEFSLQMPGNAVLFAVLAALALHQSPRLKPVSSRSIVNQGSTEMASREVLHGGGLRRN